MEEHIRSIKSDVKTPQEKKWKLQYWKKKKNYELKTQSTESLQSEAQ